VSKTKPKAATALGSYFYLFKSTTNSVDCLISAHGGYVSETRSFTVPAGVNLVFYGEHGAALLDPRIYEFAKKMSKAKPVEVFTGGQTCRNYLLSKYQGAHAGEDGKSVVETYDQVANAVSNRDYQRTEKFKDVLKADSASQQRVMEAFMADWGGSILTVRNRWNVFSGMPLSEAIKEAKKAMPTLRNFHCVFCRSYMMGDDPKAPQAVNFGG